MRKYTKEAPEKEPSVSSSQKQKSMVSDDFIESKALSEDYSKAEGWRIPKSFYVLISGGEKREKDYFKMLLSGDKFKRIKLSFEVDAKRLYPEGLLEIALDKKKYYASSQEDAPDHFFIISDIDHFYNDLVRIQPQCVREDINLIMSNPCFEIWLYYGKEKNPPKDFVIPTEQLKISQAFKTYLGTKVRGGVNPKKALYDIKSAIDHAKKHYEKDDKDIPKLFSTNMFVLASELLPLIDEELFYSDE
jgi:hypothetical protein